MAGGASEILPKRASTVTNCLSSRGPLNAVEILQLEAMEPELLTSHAANES